MEEKLELLKRSDIRTMKKDIKSLREEASEKDREKLITEKKEKTTTEKQTKKKEVAKNSSNTQTEKAKKKEEEREAIKKITNEKKEIIKPKKIEVVKPKRIEEKMAEEIEQRWQERREKEQKKQEIEKPIENIPNTQTSKKKELLEQFNQFKQILQSIWKTEKEIEQRKQGVEKKEKLATSLDEKQKIERERWQVEQEREKIEEKRWQIEDKIKKIRQEAEEYTENKREAEKDRGKQEIGNQKKIEEKEAKIASEKAIQLKQEQEKAIQLKQEQEKAIQLKQEQEKALILNEITKKENNIKQALSQILKQEQAIEQEIKKLEKQEEMAILSDKREIEQKRWETEKQRRAIEEKKWTLEAEKQKMENQRKRINLKNQELPVEKKELKREEKTPIIPQKTKEITESRDKPGIDQVKQKMENIQKKEEELRKIFLEKIEKSAKSNEPAESPQEKTIISDKPADVVFRPLPKKPGFGEKIWTRFIILLILFIILASIATFWYWYFNVKTPDFLTSFLPLKEKDQTEQEEQIALSTIPESLVLVSETKILETSSNQEIIDLFSQITQENLTKEQFIRIVIKDQTENKTIGLEEFFNAFQAEIPENLKDKLNNNFTLFIYSLEKNRFGFVVQIDDKENFQEIIKVWEKTMAKDLEPLLLILAENKKLTLSHAFKETTYKEINFNYVSFLGEKNLGICYGVFNDYFLFTTSGDVMLILIDNLKNK